VKRLFVAPAARGRGLGTRLMGELERIAREHGLSVLRLDTRHDLVESRRLYAALGYTKVPAFNDGQYAEHWLAKPLEQRQGHPVCRSATGTAPLQGTRVHHHARR
jgi:L-amino acid N-acyltransferase YncA